MKRAIKAANTTGFQSTLFTPIYSTLSQGICWQCRHRAATALRSRPSTTYRPLDRRHYASESFASRLSKRLLGRTSKDAPTKTSEGPAQDPQQQLLDQKQDPSEDELDPDYVPASHARGLPRSTNSLAKAPGGPSGIRYEKYMRNKLSGPHIDDAVYRALIEVYTLKEAGQSTTVPMAADDDRGLVFLQNAELLQSKKGGILVKWNDNQAREALIHALTTPPATDEEPIGEEGRAAYEDEALEESEPVTDPGKRVDVQSQSQISTTEEIFEPDPNETQEVTGTTSMQSGPAHSTQDVPANLKPWQQIRLKSNDTKFAILKRVMQLTGIRIPDPAIQDIRDVKTLLVELHRKPKPKRLAKVLRAIDQLQRLPNVQLQNTRLKPSDKEKQLGRWKVIVKELKERDLPIFGQRQPSEVEDMLRGDMSDRKREWLNRQMTG